MDRSENSDELLQQFNASQCESVLRHMQKNPELVEPDALMLTLGLSINSIKDHLKSLDLELKDLRYSLSKAGIDKLRVQAEGKSGLDRHLVLAPYHQLLSNDQYLELMAIDWVEYCELITSIIKTGLELHKPLAIEVFQHMVKANK